MGTYNESSTPLNEDAKSQELKPTVDKMKKLEIKEADKKQEENALNAGVTNFYAPKKKRSVSIQFLAEEMINREKEIDEKLEKRIQLLLKFYHDERMPLKYKKEMKDILNKLEVEV